MLISVILLEFILGKIHLLYNLEDQSITSSTVYHSDTLFTSAEDIKFNLAFEVTKKRESVKLHGYGILRVFSFSDLKGNDESAKLTELKLSDCGHLKID